MSCTPCKARRLYCGESDVWGQLTLQLSMSMYMFVVCLSSVCGFLGNGWLLLKHVLPLRLQSVTQLRRSDLYK